MKRILNKDLYMNFKSKYSPDDIHHVAFKTTNYKKMVDFYTNLFGCEPLYQSDQISFLAYDNEHHRIAIANTSDVLNELNFIERIVMKLKIYMNKSLPSIEGLDHISYRINPIEKWFKFYFDAKARGLLPLWTINHGWISGIYYQDPDNNLVEIFFEHFDTPDEFKNNISPDFEDEPIGTNMDIETLHEMYKSGTPFEKLIEKGNTVPEGKKPISGIEAVKNMKKKFKD
tara:strand:- start:281 stop:967 length:687 start_codon:yes stop_codon:yes gene_type:complete